MIRDVAYDGLLKRVRADLHERFVEWAEAAGRDRRARSIEVEEILGYHLEQAHRYRRRARADRRRTGVELGRRAAARLGAAGRRALERGDMPAAASLLRRRPRALPEDHADARPPALPGRRGRDGDRRVRRGRRDAGSGRRFARRMRAMGPCRAWRASSGCAWRTRSGVGATGDEVARNGERAVARFSATGHDEGLAIAWRLLLNVRITECRYGAAERAAEAIVIHATTGRQPPPGQSHAARARAARPPRTALGARMPSSGAQRIIGELADDRQAAAVARRALAHLRAMRGEIDAGREECRRCRAELEEFGWMLDAALVSLDAGPIALLADDPAGAEDELRRDLGTLEHMGDRNYISTTSALLAEALYRQERLAEAAEAVAFSREVAADDDLATQIIWRSVHGKLLVRDGESAAGIAACREALAIAERTDDVTARGDAQYDLGEALRLSGDRLGARMALGAARREHSAKGNVVAVARIDHALGELRA